MRKLLSITGAALLATTTLVTPANAQAMPMAMGSCGPMEGMYGMNNVDEGMTPGETVTGLFYQVQYMNVPAPTTVGVLIRYNDELESQTGQATFVANAPNGTFTSAIRANISPEAQGGGVTRFNARSLTISNRGHGRQGGTAGSPQIGGGITEGEYVFYVYTGTMRETAEGRMFEHDPAGYLGRFSCGVSDIGGN